MNKTRRLTVIALLAAISFVLMVFPQFPLIPGATFLKIDFSFVPVLIGALMLDLKSGYAILILRSLLKVLLNNSGVNDYSWIDVGDGHLELCLCGTVVCDVC